LISGKRLFPLLFLVLIATAFLACAYALNSIRFRANLIILERAHAHNDYNHEHPFYDALENRFASIEVDIHLINGELLVAHDAHQAQAERTLQALYLDPLLKHVMKNKGQVYRHGSQLTLFIDIKTDADSTFTLLHKILKEYKDILTVYNENSRTQGAVSIIISGNRPRKMMEREPVRYAAYDGRFEDLETNDPVELIPIISDRWFKFFTWNGEGTFTEEERQKLRAIIEEAHKQGKWVRFWGTPDYPSPAREAVWRELLLADVDLINSDDLAGLKMFLLKND